jgi:hypothetical protein
MPSVDSPAKGGELLTFVRVVWVDVALLATEDVAKRWVKPEALAGFAGPDPGCLDLAEVFSKLSLSACVL